MPEEQITDCGLQMTVGFEGWMRNLGLEDGVAGGADFGGQDLQDFERHEGVVLHEGGEAFSCDEAELGAGVGDGGEGVGLVADQAGKSKQGAGDCIDANDRFFHI